MTVKRSGREGRWADMPSARVRFAAEAAFLLVVAGGAALARLSPLQIILLMFVAWVLVAVIERASSRAKSRVPAPHVDEVPAPPVADELPAEPQIEAAGDRRRWTWRARREKAVEPLAAPTAPLEERPSRTHVRRLEPEPGAAELDAELAELLAAETTARGPSVTKRALDLPGLEEPERPAPEKPEPGSVPGPIAAAPTTAPRVEPPPPPPPPREPTQVPAAEHRPPPAPSPAPREWNLWDLESRARDHAGVTARHEEWTALFVHLREFASADGLLPVEFDELVRDSFAELIQAA
jgi:hypothetical protein